MGLMDASLMDLALMGGNTAGPVRLSVGILAEAVRRSPASRRNSVNSLMSFGNGRFGS
jgi:hypothetical protein